MKEYKDLENNSNIEAYTYDDHRFVVRLKNGEEKEYTEKMVTFFDLDCLKERANAGRGLDEYIRDIESRDPD